MMKKIVIDAIEEVTGAKVSMNTELAWWVPMSRCEREIVEIDSLDFECIMDIVEEKIKQKFDRRAIYGVFNSQCRQTVGALISVIEARSSSMRAKESLQLNVSEAQRFKQRCVKFFSNLIKQK